MDTYVANVAELVAALDLRNGIHVGHSTGGGEVARYVAQHGDGRVAKADSAVPPLMVKTAANPGDLPKDVFDRFQAQLVANRAQFYYDVPAGPFYGYNRPGAKVSQGLIWNWWRQGMMVEECDVESHRGAQMKPVEHVEQPPYANAISVVLAAAPAREPSRCRLAV